MSINRLTFHWKHYEVHIILSKQQMHKTLEICIQKLNNHFINYHNLWTKKCVNEIILWKNRYCFDCQCYLASTCYYQIFWHFLIFAYAYEISLQYTRYIHIIHVLPVSIWDIDDEEMSFYGKRKMCHTDTQIYRYYSQKIKLTCQ